MFNFIYRPYIFLLFHIFSFILALKIYASFENGRNNEYFYLYTGILGVITIITAFIDHAIINSKKIHSGSFKIFSWKWLTFAVIVTAFLEYSFLGFPILKQISYHVFGFPFLHHITVSSWLLVFAISKDRKISINIMLILIALINPILMVNRDVFLLTIFSLIFVLNNEFKVASIIKGIIGATVVFVFGFIGQYRSPEALERVTLPFSFGFTKLNPLAQWLVLYISSPMFNLSYNFSSYKAELYYKEINTFPEVTNWLIDYGALGIVFFYGSVSLILLCAKFFVVQNPRFFAIYIYLAYQAIMSGFSRKFYLSNTLFTCLLAFILFLFERKCNKIKTAE